MSDCGCSSDQFLPICGSDGNNYYSPCHAGCSDGSVQVSLLFALLNYAFVTNILYGVNNNDKNFWFKFLTLKYPAIVASL